MDVEQRRAAFPLLQILTVAGLRMSAADEAASPAVERSRLREWGRLVGVLLLILSPLLLAGVVLEGLAWHIGETMPVSVISTWQDGAADRIWRGGDGHSFLTYKLARVADLKPEIIALGPSRANAFKGDGFAPYTFFNAGLTAWTFDQYRRFLELITRDGYAPRALVFNMDYWMLSSGFDHYWVDRFDEKPATHVSDLLRVVAQLREDPLRLWRNLPRADHVHGLYAVLTGEGFRADGSPADKPGTPDPALPAGDETGVGTPPVVLADHIAAEQVANFEQFATLAKAKHVALIGIQLPYYEKILNGLNGNPQAGIWREFESTEWHRRFADSGVIFFDFADMPAYRDKPEYFLDSLDPDARVVSHITQQVMADPRVRALLPKAGMP
jgi:hypothetical protein